MQIRKTAHRTLTIPQTKPIGLLQKMLTIRKTPTIKPLQKNYAGKSSYDKNCHNDAYDEDEME